MRSAFRLSSILMFLALGAAACTSSEPSETTNGGTRPSTTIVEVTRPTFDMTNFSMDQLINGPTLNWAETWADESVSPHGLVRLKDEWFLFTSSDMSTDGLTAWSSGDGLEWREIGVIVPPGPDIGAIEVVEESLVIATKGDSRQQAGLWLSDNGTDWTHETIPIDVENPFLAFSPTAIGGDGEVFVIVGQSQIDALDLIQSSVRETFGLEYDLGRYGYAVDPIEGDLEITLLGPLGFSAMTTSAIELGIGEREVSWLGAEPNTSDTEVWLRYGPADWIAAEIDGATEITSIASAPDGGLIAVGFSPTEQTVLWESFEGTIWVQIPFGVRPYDLARWNDLLIGPSSVGSHDLVTSHDGIDWSATGLSNHLPPSLGWDFPAIGSNRDAVVAIVEAWQARGRNDPTLEFPLIERDGLVISVEANRGGGGIRVFEDVGEEGLEEGEEIFGDSWSASSAADSQRVVIDPVAETMLLLREDGSDLVTLTFDELDRLLEDEFRFIQSFQIRHRAIGNSQDGQTWTISNLPDIGEDLDIVEVGVTDFSIFVVSTDHIEATGVQIWTAPIR